MSYIYIVFSEKLAVHGHVQFKRTTHTAPVMWRVEFEHHVRVSNTGIALTISFDRIQEINVPQRCLIVVTKAC